MVGESGRLTVSVGQHEFQDLTAAWASYVEATRATGSPVDPILAMQRTGSVLRSLDRVMATLTSTSDAAQTSDAASGGAEA